MTEVIDQVVYLDMTAFAYNENTQVNCFLIFTNLTDLDSSMLTSHDGLIKLLLEKHLVVQSTVK